MRLLGINNDRKACDCCNKGTSEKVVWLEDYDDAVVAYAVDCAARALKVPGEWAARKAEQLVNAVHGDFVGAAA